MKPMTFHMLTLKNNFKKDKKIKKTANKGFPPSPFLSFLFLPLSLSLSLLSFLSSFCTLAVESVPSPQLTNPSDHEGGTFSLG